MSGWDGYVNDMMKNTGSFDNSVILGLDDRSTWAATSDFSISDEEAKALLKLAQLAPPQSQLKAQVFKVNGIEFEPIFVEKGRIYSEKVSNRNAGLLALVSKQCIIIGTYPPAVPPGLAVDTLERLVIYLGEQGF